MDHEILDQQFLDLLRARLPLAGDGPITADSALRSLGVDSMRSIELLFAVEDAFGIVLPDDRLTDQTFETVGTLWCAVRAERARQGVTRP